MRPLWHRPRTCRPCSPGRWAPGRPTSSSSYRYPPSTSTGLLSFCFLVHGSRHVDPTGAHLAQLRPGDQLYLAPEDDNPTSTVAVLVGGQPHPTRDHSLGYVPDVLATLVRALLASGTPYRATAEQVNQPSASHLPDHMRLLVRLDAVALEDFDVEATLPV